jgi:hypothetical protein
LWALLDMQSYLAPRKVRAQLTFIVVIRRKACRLKPASYLKALQGRKHFY